jgi:hypothetical protein
MNNFQIDAYKNFVGIVDDNFLSSDEVNDIKEKVFNNSHLWENYFTVNVLPSGHSYIRDPKMYVASVKKYQKILEDNFFSVYEKLHKKINDTFNCKCDFMPDKHKPGFHIFGPGPLVHVQKHYHTDNFHNITEKIYSYTIPIVLPLEPTGLSYLDPLGSYPKHASKDYLHRKHTKTVFYKPGCLVMIDGAVTHAIKPFTLDKNEYRITMQLHVGLNRKDPDRSFIFW